MPAQELQKQLDTLREQLEQNPPLSEVERQDLRELMAQIESEIQLESATQDASIADGVNLAVDRFELEHPAIAGTLRNIVNALGSMGI
ncbi:chromosome partitioning protein ParA [Pseudomonas chlororaphis]|uniref:Chromosome partitioning protein ParA n=1 Tax=Pseudomonas chlororaphis TaxID=587753 RepID=A0A0A6DEQ6_9PSED|nr:chromosome partitioning protein ParA [Pseudomonas chlororaphis]